MRRILVTQRVVVDATTGELRDALDVRWASFLSEVGLAAVPVPSGVDVGAWLLAIGEVAGVLLTGGNDVVSVDASPENERREALETALLAAVGADAPLLGVCRGAQLLAHLDGFDLAPIDGHVRTRHALERVPGSGASSLARHAGRVVGSYHRIGVSGSGRALAAVLRSTDGVIEAVEARGRSRVGILWHPEREAPYHESDIELFRETFR